jgi:hypothetical protein
MMCSEIIVQMKIDLIIVLIVHLFEKNEAKQRKKNNLNYVNEMKKD